MIGYMIIVHHMMSCIVRNHTNSSDSSNSVRQLKSLSTTLLILRYTFQYK